MMAGMRIVALLLILGTLSLDGCGPRVPTASEPEVNGTPLGRLPTSPTGVGDEAPAGLPARVIFRAREFRGNPIPLGVLTGSVLVAALVLGLYTVRLAYRRPPDEHAS
jgi:hypothetical protein